MGHVISYDKIFMQIMALRFLLHCAANKPHQPILPLTVCRLEFHNKVKIK